MSGETSRRKGGGGETTKKVSLRGASPLVFKRFHSFSLPFAEPTASSVQATYKLL